MSRATLYVAFQLGQDALIFAQNPFSENSIFPMNGDDLVFARTLNSLDSKESAPQAVVAVQYDGLLHEMLQGCYGKSRRMTVDGNILKVAPSAFFEILTHYRSRLAILVPINGQSWKDVENLGG